MSEALAAGVSSVFRTYGGRLSKAEATPSGGIRVPASVTRSGILTYTRADGSKQREYRPREEVFSEASLATLRGAPVTNRHPVEPVTSANWKTLAIGHAGDSSREDGDHVATDLYVLDADSIASVDSGDLSEVSCGYTCNLELTPGTYGGEDYDVVQRDIRYNHIGLGPDNWGRAGKEIRLRLDDAGNVLPDAVAPEKEREKIMKVIKIDGKEYEYGSEAHLAKVGADADALLALETSRADAAEGKLVTAEKALEEHKSRLDSAASPEVVAKLVAARVALETRASVLGGVDFKCDGDDLTVMTAAIAKADSSVVTEGKSLEYVTAIFDTLKVSGPSVSTRKDALEALTPSVNEIPSADAQRAAFIAASKAASKAVN